MSKDKIEVLAMGNAIVDMTAIVTDEFLTEHDVTKGIMHLVDSEKSNEIYKNIDVSNVSAGGSAANTIYSLAKLGVSSGFIGKISEDELGGMFEDSIKGVGVEYKTKPVSQDKEVSTSKCMVLITPDSERTMCTYLGASGHITAFDVDEEMIAKSEITYLEGYLFDGDETKKAFKMVADIAHKGGKKIALSLSDPFCVERHHKDLAEFIEKYVDILFCNEEEIKALCKSEDLPKTMPHCSLVIITRGDKGVVIISKDEYVEVPADTDVEVIDLNGAGDGFAAGFLYGYVKELPLKTCGEIGVAIASEVISTVGARPETDLTQLLINKNNLIG